MRINNELKKYNLTEKTSEEDEKKVTTEQQNIDNTQQSKASEEDGYSGFVLGYN